MTGTTQKRPIYKNPDVLIFWLIVIAALGLRLYMLDVRPFHHDESAVGSFTYKLFLKGDYEYNPVFHGPFLYHLTSTVFKLMGDSEFSARLMPALTGVGMVLLAYPFRRYLGRPGWLITAAFFAFSPSFLYYSRFFRNDIFITFFTFLAVICAAKYLEKGNGPGRLPYLALGSASLALSVTIKENAYITLAIFAAPVGLFVMYKVLKSLHSRRLVHDSIMFIERNMGRMVMDTTLFVVIFSLIFTMFYSNFFNDMEAVKSAPFKAFSHWYRMHEIERIGGPPWYYIPLMFLYELPVIVFALVGSLEYIERLLRKQIEPMKIFLVYWFAASLAAYAYVGEKVPWLILHPLLPAVLIAGAYLGESLPDMKKRPVGVEALFVIILLLSSSFFVYTSYNLNYNHYADPAEPLIQASQPPEKFQEFLDTLNRVALEHDGFHTEIQNTDIEMETQLLWYLRHYENIKWRINLENDPKLEAPLIIVHDLDADYVETVVSNKYQRLDSAKMAWYFYKLSDIDYDFIMYRHMDRPPGEYGVVLFYYT